MTGQVRTNKQRRNSFVFTLRTLAPWTVLFLPEGFNWKLDF